MPATEHFISFNSSIEHENAIENVQNETKQNVFVNNKCILRLVSERVIYSFGLISALLVETTIRFVVNFI